MEEILLDVETREEIGRADVKNLRKKGFTPAVIYAQGKETLAVKISTHQLISMVHQHRLESMVVHLKLKGDTKNKSRACLIKEMQHDPVTGNIVHVDFNEISLTKAIKVNVPVVAKGEPVGVKLEGGSLEHILWEVEVECLPTDIPKDIEVDVSQLKIGDAIHIKDIVFPANIKVLSDPGAVVLSVMAPMKEEVPVEPVEGEEKQEPEVIKEKKEVPAEGEAAEGKEAKETKEKKEK
ncbi:MAG: 50S ribosomal protein L25 [Candidatus Omnitrophica bacterium]|nr:50S ribosomal protein L25 [Candidatus Omnitrophota bacterium]